MSRIKDVGIWNPRIRTVGTRNPDGWNPESRWLESGIRNPEGWNPESKTPVDSVTWGDSYLPEIGLTGVYAVAILTLVGLFSD